MPLLEPSVPERPRLAAGVRLHFDRRRGVWVLLCPERVIEAEGPAHEIHQRCDGSRTVEQIEDELAVLYAADRATIGDDVTEMLADMAAKRLVVA